MGKRVSLFYIGLPRHIVLNEKTPQKALSILYDLGIQDVIKDNNGSDNKK